MEPEFSCRLGPLAGLEHLEQCLAGWAGPGAPFYLSPGCRLQTTAVCLLSHAAGGLKGSCGRVGRVGADSLFLQGTLFLKSTALVPSGSLGPPPA